MTNHPHHPPLHPRPRRGEDEVDPTTNISALFQQPPRRRLSPSHPQMPYPPSSTLQPHLHHTPFHPLHYPGIPRHHFPPGIHHGRFARSMMDIHHHHHHHHNGGDFLFPGSGGGGGGNSSSTAARSNSNGVGGPLSDMSSSNATTSLRHNHHHNHHHNSEVNDIEALQNSLAAMEDFFQSLLGQAHLYMEAMDPNNINTSASGREGGPPPASEETIENLPKIKFTKDEFVWTMEDDDNNNNNNNSKHDREDENEDDHHVNLPQDCTTTNTTTTTNTNTTTTTNTTTLPPTCEICCDDFEENMEVTRLPCGHIFHGPCVTEWLQRHCTCPVCRYELVTDDESYEPGRIERMKDRPLVPSFYNNHHHNHHDNPPKQEDDNSSNSCSNSSSSHEEDGEDTSSLNNRNNNNEYVRTST
mmetsp:Transcript_13644/g.21309  ORF Transcript_13644/g.21309 Transcript_13644/m.21309 type:complete len:414 (-) Transcript_13644:221-1462(-)